MALVLRRLVPFVFLALLLAPAASAWSWPVQGPVLQLFSFDHAHPYAAGQHRGIDVGAPAGSAVVAPADGVVTFAGTVPTSGTSLTILTADGHSVTLTHLGTLAVARGATVAEGDAVGTIGPSGTPELDVPYLHLGIRVVSDPNGYLDPLTLLPAAAPSPAPTPTATSAEPLPSAAPAADATPAAPSTAPAAAEPLETMLVATTSPATGHAANEQTVNEHRANERAANERAASEPAATHPASAPAARVTGAAPATVRRPETRHARLSRPAPAHTRLPVRKPATIAQARGRSRTGRQPQPLGETTFNPRHRPVPATAPSHERPTTTPTRVPVVPLALGAALAALAIAALAGVLRLRRRPASPPELGAVVIPLPLRPVGLEERRVA